MLVTKVKHIKKAVEDKRWNKLLEFDNLVLKNAILLNCMADLKKYYYGMGIQKYKMLFPALRMLEAENLLYLTFDDWLLCYMNQNLTNTKLRSSLEPKAYAYYVIRFSVP